MSRLQRNIEIIGTAIVVICPTMIFIASTYVTSLGAVKTTADAIKPEDYAPRGVLRGDKWK